MRLSGLLFCLMAMVFLGGCGSGSKPKVPVYKVTGKVTYKGQPVVGADVTFICTEANKSAFGRTNEDGVYKLTTYSSNDGAVEGRHAVAIVQIPVVESPTTPLADVTTDEYVPPELNQSTQAAPPKTMLPEKYGDVATSGLSAVVSKDEDNVNDFDLD